VWTGTASVASSPPSTATHEEDNEGDDAREPARLGYQPGLDGLRAVSLAGVLLFHQGYRPVPGGFLGVSTFFTLSGFLITTLALSEWDGTGRLSPARFYERRARRLLPAALLTVAGVVALRAFTDVGAGQAFRGDVLAALGYAANWRFAATGDDYAALFAQPSPVLHFWSLAIEEQFYVAFPLLFGLVAAIVGRRATRRGGPGGARLDDRALAVGGGVFALLASASFGTAWVLASRDGNDGVTYYGTHTRAGELLVGVALAYALRSGRCRRLLARRAVTAALVAAGAVALAGLVALWHEASLDSPRLFHGGTLANAGLSAVVIAAVLRPGPLRAGLGLWPLRMVGKVSYGAYLFHWPVFLWLDAPRVDLGQDRLFALRLAVTLALATASYHLLEAPFRFRLRMPRPRLATGLVGAAAVAAALVVVVPARETDRIDFAAAGAPAGTPAAPPSTEAGAGDGGTPTPTDNPSAAEGDPLGEPDVEPQFPFLRQEGLVKPTDGAAPAIRILLVGDSLSASMIAGLEGWNEEHPDQQIWVDSHSVFGCPMVDTGVTPLIGTWTTTAQCVDWHQDLDNALVRWDTDAVLMMAGLADLQGHMIGGQMIDMGNPTHDEWFRTELDRLATTMTAPGVPVLWTNFPHVRMASPSEPTKDWTDFVINQPWRVDRLNEILAEVAAAHPGVTPVDLDGWVHSWPEGEFDAARRDGVHFLDTGSDLAADWLVPQLIDLAEG
jgi:peptidoglycan/LPS O-acetylase OafA/YrhL